MRLVNLDTQAMYSYDETSKPGCPRNEIMEPRPQRGPRIIVFKEWRDTRTFSNLKSTHCTLLILLITNLVTKKSLCIVSKVQREQ
jgi:hypothetical protein